MCKAGSRRGADHFNHANALAHHAARHHAATNHSIQRLKCADPATRVERQDTFRTATLRSGSELYPDAACHYSGRASAVAVRWEVAPGDGRYRSAKTLWQGPLTYGCEQRCECAERHSACRHAKNW